MAWWPYTKPDETSATGGRKILDSVFVGSGDAEVRTGATGEMTEREELEVMGTLFDCDTGAIVVGDCFGEGDIQCDLLNFELLQVPSPSEEYYSPILGEIAESVNAVFKPLAQKAQKLVQSHPTMKDVEITVVPTAKGLQLAWARPLPEKRGAQPPKKLTLRIEPNWWGRWRRNRRHKRARRLIQEKLRPCLEEKRNALKKRLPGLPKAGGAPTGVRAGPKS